MLLLMGFPFALISYGHALLRPVTGIVSGRLDWKSIIVFWIGMPLSFMLGALTILAETGIMQALGFGVRDLPLYDLRLLIGEAAACAAWTTCILFWCRRSQRKASFLLLCVALVIIVMGAYGFSTVLFRAFHKDLYILLASVSATTLSAVFLVLPGSRYRAS
jgi:hypothetical protein